MVASEGTSEEHMSFSAAQHPRHICFLNMPIEFYSPVTGGAISTIISNSAQVLENRGYFVSVLSRIDDSSSYTAGILVPLRQAGREDLSFVNRRLSGLRWRMNDWDWPFYDYYCSAFERALQQLPKSPDVVVLFNDLISPIRLRKLLPNAKICVWLQNEQRTRSRNIRSAVQSTDLWFACSDYIRHWTTTTHGIPNSRVHTVPSGINLEQFFPRADYAAAQSPVRVLFVGRIDPNKGADLAVDAVAQLRAEGLSVTMTVAGGRWFYGNGDDSEDPYFCSLRDKMTATDAVYLGHVTRDRLPDVFREHDIVCVLSRSQEPFGLVVLEAMASGCAVLASDRGGLPQACGGAAVLLDPDNRSSITEALRRWVTEPRLLAEAKQVAVARARAASWSVTVDRLEQLVPEEIAR